MNENSFPEICPVCCGWAVWVPTLHLCNLDTAKQLLFVNYANIRWIFTTFPSSQSHCDSKNELEWKVECIEKSPNFLSLWKLSLALGCLHLHCLERRGRTVKIFMEESFCRAFPLHTAQGPHCSQSVGYTWDSAWSRAKTWRNMGN